MPHKSSAEPRWSQVSQVSQKAVTRTRLAAQGQTDLIVLTHPPEPAMPSARSLEFNFPPCGARLEFTN